MIQKLREIFKQDSEFIQFLKQSCLTKDNQVYHQEDFEFLLQYMIKERNLRDFFEFYSNLEMQTYNTKMKMLIITHQFIHSNEEFSKLFTTLRLTNFCLLKHSHRNYETWLLFNIQIPFLSYLQKLAISQKEIKSYKTCIFRKQQNSNIVIDSFKIINIVNVALSLVSNLKTALLNYPYDILLQRLSFNLYQEIQGFQKNLINSMILIQKENPKIQNVEMYELLREINFIEQRMIYYHQFRNLYDPKESLLSPLQTQQQFEYYKTQLIQHDCKTETKKEYLQRSPRTRQSTGGEATSPKSQRMLNYFEPQSSPKKYIKKQVMVIQEESEIQIDQI
ncbi:unnamed protein product (macronuclear) [Paramecium tetraurelia]|uniref:Uncharacterized protein n=1 Tax=Paramecium tetraurelia TaxID=5888 RepID=A0BS44_PARTE|nr:uncharacterized protein GSPATT00031592001 [Paramecium tetraurelia]CAK61361.1 unnamed protein product [Paramecium tetraurelia]|eukprot:XP_001428759.1 hypothetical protein (macronuclear) [Paramecium tetraurelia strain d4-2]